MYGYRSVKHKPQIRSHICVLRTIYEVYTTKSKSIHSRCVCKQTTWILCVIGDKYFLIWKVNLRFSLFIIFCSFASDLNTCKTNRFSFLFTVLPRWRLKWFSRSRVRTAKWCWEECENQLFSQNINSRKKNKSKNGAKNVLINWNCFSFD